MQKVETNQKPSATADKIAHTPGPWIAESDGNINAYSEPSVNIAQCRGGLSFAQNAANARLIAAAPETAAERDRLLVINAELLEACHQAMIWLNHYGDDPKMMSEAHSYLVEKVAKAEVK